MWIPQTIVATPEWVSSQDTSDWLTSREHTQFGEMSSSRRRAERLAGRLAVKRLLWSSFGVGPLNYEIGTDGLAPTLIGWPTDTPPVISLSHSDGLGAASWSFPGREGSVGVDAQHIREVHPGLAARVLTASEQAQARDQERDEGILLLWSLKEAAIKARRRPWGRALREAVVALDSPRDRQGAAWIEVAGEPGMRAWYERRGDWWVARAVAATRP